MTSFDGLLLVDKPSGPTSHDIVDRVRRALGIRAVGHAGTLDPFASGLLILGVGKGTKRLTALVGHDKTYEIEARLGQRTDTFDREGQPLGTPHQGEPPSRDTIEALLPHFRGTIQQKAPLYSAIKRQGKKLYELARAGTATEDMRPIREVTIHELELLEYVWPTLKLRARVSSGTYIRSLVDDIGTELGTGAFVQELRRTRVGELDVANAIDGDHLSLESISAALQTETPARAGV
jgi:tRNA pseudouridine55 synthase